MTERECIRQEAVWQVRLEALPKDLNGTERAQVTETLRALLASYTPRGETSAG